MRQSFGITVVLLLLWACLWWLRRSGFATFGTRTRASGQLQIIERVNLSPQHSVQLVRVSTRTLVLGVHPAGITLLRDWEGGQ